MPQGQTRELCLRNEKEQQRVVKGRSSEPPARWVVGWFGGISTRPFQLERVPGGGRWSLGFFCMDPLKDTPVNQFVYELELLQNEFQIEDRIEAATEAFLANGQLGERAPRV